MKRDREGFMRRVVVILLVVTVSAAAMIAYQGCRDYERRAHEVRSLGPTK